MSGFRAASQVKEMIQRFVLSVNGGRSVDSQSEEILVIIDPLDPWQFHFGREKVIIDGRLFQRHRQMQFSLLISRLEPIVGQHRNPGPADGRLYAGVGLIRLFLAGNVIKGKFEMMLIAEFGRQPDFNFLVKIGIFAVPRDWQVSMPDKFWRGGFAENDRHGERLVFACHELDFDGDISGLAASVGEIETQWRDIQQIAIMMMRGVDLLSREFQEALDGNHTAGG